MLDITIALNKMNKCLGMARFLTADMRYAFNYLYELGLAAGCSVLLNEGILPSKFQAWTRLKGYKVKSLAINLIILSCFAHVLS